jgi:hypothetical protein
VSFSGSIVDLRLRTAIPDSEMESKVGKMLTPDDFNILLTRGARVRKPDGSLLAVYLPGAIDEALAEQAYPTLHKLRNTLTANRGLAAGSQRVPIASSKRDDREGAYSGRTEAKRVASAIVGAFDPQGPRSYCRLTAFAARETDAWAEVHPMLRQISDLFREHVPDRFAAQARVVAETDPHWTIPGTVFSTVTVNNTYETGVHTDKGDLDEGFSTIAVLRRGRPYRGGVLVFPRYRIGVDLQDRDLLLMDAHEWHGNTLFDPPIKRLYTGRPVEDPGFERISVVSYYRTRLTQCGTPETEAEKQRLYAEQRSQAAVGE